MGDLIQRAIELANKAILADSEGDIKEAVNLYKESVATFSTAIKFEQNPHIKQASKQKMNEYLSRAEELAKKQNEKKNPTKFSKKKPMSSVPEVATPQLLSVRVKHDAGSGSIDKSEVQNHRNKDKEDESNSRVIANNDHSIVVLECDPESFLLAEFAAWGRDRFRIDSASTVRYLIHPTMKEVLPSKSVLTSLLEDQYIIIRSDCNSNGNSGDDSQKNNYIKDSNNKSNSNNRSESLHSSSIVRFTIKYYPYIIMILLAISLSKDFQVWFDEMLPAFLKLESLLEQINIGDREYVRNIIIDAFIGFVSWSSCYLYIRRLMNPETMEIAFPKFATDACFGGLASAAAAALKIIIKRNLSK